MTNREKHLARATAYHLANYEKRLTQMVAWRRANPEKNRAAVAAWARANPEKTRVNKNAWARANPEKRRAKNALRRARLAGAIGSHTVAEWIALCWGSGWTCLYCGKRLTAKTVTRDHRIAITRGGSHYIGNMAAACLSCNASKGTMSDIEFMSTRAADRIFAIA